LVKQKEVTPGNDIKTRVTLHLEDMLSIKNAGLDWKFGKIIKIIEGGESIPALVVGLKEFTVNALLLKR